MDGRTHGQRENSIPPTNNVCGGYNHNIMMTSESVTFIFNWFDYIIWCNDSLTRDDIRDSIFPCIRASTRENMSSEFAMNKGADQPVHRRSLISAFVILLL